MKTYVFCLLFVFIAIYSSCQNSNDKKEVQRVFTLMSDYLKKEDYEAVYDMSYPNSFGNYTKEEVLQDLKSAVNNEGYELRLKDDHIDSISEIYTSGSKKYARVDYTADAILRFKLLPGEDSSAMRARFNKFCSNGLQMEGNDYIKCDPEKEIIYYKQKACVFFIYRKPEQRWFALSAENAAKNESLIPKGIRLKLAY